MILGKIEVLASHLDKSPKEDAVPLLLRTIGNKRLSKSDIERLIEIVRGTPNAGKKSH